MGRPRTGEVNARRLLAGSSSIYQSLRAGVALADLLDDPQPEWELAGGRLGHALREHRDLFLDKSTYSMDWYYPVLGGAVRGRRGLDLLESRWDEFVVPGLGIRCVDTNPWVTGAETCELVMALDASTTTGARWRCTPTCSTCATRTAATGPARCTTTPRTSVFWPVEQTTYTAAAVILAADALVPARTPGSGIMRGDPARARTSARSPSSAAAWTMPQPTSSPAAPDVRVSTRIEPDAPRPRVKAPPVERAQPDVVRRLAAVLGSLEDVVDDQHARRAAPSGAQPV